MAARDLPPVCPRCTGRGRWAYEDEYGDITCRYCGAIQPTLRPTEDARSRSALIRMMQQRG